MEQTSHSARIDPGCRAVLPSCPGGHALQGRDTPSCAACRQGAPGSNRAGAHGGCPPRAGSAGRGPACAGGPVRCVQARAAVRACPVRQGAMPTEAGTRRRPRRAARVPREVTGEERTTAAPHPRAAARAGRVRSCPVSQGVLGSLVGTRRRARRDAGVRREATGRERTTAAAHLGWAAPERVRPGFCASTSPRRRWPRTAPGRSGPATAAPR